MTNLNRQSQLQAPGGSGIAPRWTSRVKNGVAATLLAAIGLAAVVADGHRSLAGLTRPFDIDQFRDVAAAQAIVDGHPLRDPFYRGETIWYNPLLSATVAMISRVTRGSVASTFVQWGPFLNALAPAAMFLMTAALFGEWPALIAIVSLVLSPPHDNPAWASPTYSPWLFPATFAPAFFYVGILLCYVAARRNELRWWMAAGAGLGVTFLAHTAPALILGVCCAMSVVTTRKATSVAKLWRSRAYALTVVMGAAVTVASPLIWSIAVHYRLHVVNAAPNNWTWNALEIGHARDLVRGWISYRSLPPLAGALVVVRGLKRDPAARLVACWGVAAAAFFGYGYLQQLAGFDHLPPLVPQYHFYLYFRAAGHVLTGIGTWAIVSGIISTAAGRAGIVDRRWSPALAGVTLAIVLAAFVATNLAGYRQRPGFRRERAIAADRGWSEASANLTERLRTETPQEAVVLASLDDSIFKVAPAGRRVVAVPAAFSNPYVDFTAREADARHMLYAFARGDVDGFRSLASSYGITHVLLAEEAPGDVVAVRAAGVTLLSWKSDVSLYEVSDSWRRP